MKALSNTDVTVPPIIIQMNQFDNELQSNVYLGVNVELL